MTRRSTFPAAVAAAFALLTGSAWSATAGFNSSFLAGQRAAGHAQFAPRVFTSRVPRRNAPGLTVLYSFKSNGTNGQLPQGGLTADEDGALYGTTALGGTAGGGTVYKLTPSGGGYTETVLYNFQNGADGSWPMGELVVDKTGAIYGTALSGGSTNCLSGCGTVFKLTPSGSGYTESTMHGFQGGTDGGLPMGGLIEDTSGRFYGTTQMGGSAKCGRFNGGCGTVFSIERSGSGYSERIIHRFQFLGMNSGMWPSAGLTMDSAGVLYGATAYGGKDLGTVFKLTPTSMGYTDSKLSGVCCHPEGTVLLDSTGALYGTTYGGGGVGESEGSVFKLTPSGGGYTESVLHAFQGHPDGGRPTGGLIGDASGAIYGTTGRGGGQGNGGMVFKLTPSGSTYTIRTLHAFTTGADGAEPVGNLLRDTSGAIYGVTQYGGAHGGGTVYMITP